VTTSSRNFAFVAVLALALAGGLAALVGPGRARTQRAGAQLAELQERANAWALRRGRFRAASERERAAWRAQWEELLGCVSEVDGEAALIADVSERLEIAGLRGVQVVPVSTAQGETAEPPVVLRAPDRDASTRVSAVPVELSFRASYGELLALLGRIEGGGVPARLQAVELRRHGSGIAARLRLLWSIRAPEEATS
jgi:hypothetical protein